jgi:uncharacterized membrane protein HdeD (DUF308 family)
MKTPFTIEQFFGVFEKYNSAVFPIQLVLVILGIIALILIHSKKESKNKLITGFLSFLWLWIGIVYHMVFFTSVTKAAYLFGGLFIIQGILLTIALFRKQLVFKFEGSTREYIGYFFIVFGLIIYPVISYWLEGSFALTITLGLPCPTTILTFGFLMLTNRRFPKYLLIIPTLWALIGTRAAISFGVYQDYMMLLSAVVADIYLFGRKKGTE